MDKVLGGIRETAPSPSPSFCPASFRVVLLSVSTRVRLCLCVRARVNHWVLLLKRSERILSFAFHRAPKLEKKNPIPIVVDLPRLQLRSIHVGLRVCVRAAWSSFVVCVFGMLCVFTVLLCACVFLDSVGLLLSSVGGCGSFLGLFLEVIIAFGLFLATLGILRQIGARNIALKYF